MVDSNRFASTPSEQEEENTNSTNESETEPTGQTDTQAEETGTNQSSSTNDTSSTERERLGTIRVPSELKDEIETVKQQLNEESMSGVKISKNAAVVHLLERGVESFSQERKTGE